MAVTLHAHTMSAVLSGNRGAVGVGIADITFNDDYTMTITLTDGSTYTSGNLRGAQGIPGIDAEYDGEELVITTGDHTETDGGDVSTIRVKGEARVIRDRVTEEMAFSAYPTETASGDIVSITDGAEDIPVKALTVTVEPVQDLHGQDAPYPAGGGKNLLPMTVANIKAINTAGKWNGNAYTLSGVTYTLNTDNGENIVAITVNGTASAYSLFRLVNEWTNSEQTYLSGAPSTSSATGWRIQAEGDSIRQDIGQGISLSSGYSATRIMIVVPSGVNPNNAVFKPMIRLFSVTDATFAPYSNICPITGWDAVNVVRTGKNLWEFESHIETSSYVQKTFANYLPAGTYTLSAIVTTEKAEGTIDMRLRKQDGSALITVQLTANTGARTYNVFTLTEPAYRAYVYGSNTTSGYNGSWTDIQIEQGSTATAYEPYNATTYPISLPSTVYGGTLDVLTGVMTVDRAMITPNAYAKQSVNDNGIANYTFTLSSVGLADDARRLESISNILPYGANSISSETRPSFIIANPSTGYVRLRDSEVDTVEKANTWISDNGLYIVYCLNTKTTITLDPVTISTLLGDNTIYADAGQVTVAYRADVGLYIDKRIAEVQALVLES